MRNRWNKLLHYADKKENTKVENRIVIKISYSENNSVFFNILYFIYLDGIFTANFVFVLSVILADGIKYFKVK